MKQSQKHSHSAASIHLRYAQNGSQTFKWILYVLARLLLSIRLYRSALCVKQTERVKLYPNAKESR